MIRPLVLNDFLFILEAAKWTVLLSFISFVGGSAIGAVIATMRLSTKSAVRFSAIGYIRLFQGTPLLIQLFVVFFLPSMIGIQVTPLIAASIGLCLNSGAFLGEIWRGCLEAVAPGQWDAGRALGFRYFKILRLVILPQAVRIAIPPTVGFLVQLIKATSLAAIIGFTELTRAGQILINSTFRPFLIFSVIAACYFAICWPLSILSRRLEKAQAPAA